MGKHHPAGTAGTTLSDKGSPAWVYAWHRGWETPAEITSKAQQEAHQAQRGGQLEISRAKPRHTPF